MKWNWTPNNIKMLAEISANIGHVALASMALPFFLDKYEPVRGIIGLLFAIAFWVASLVILNEEYEY